MKKNQQGFSIVEILLVTAVIGLIVVVGWLVYDKQKSKTTSQQTITQTKAETPKAETPKKEETKPDTKYLEIKEYNLKIVLSKDIEDAYYVMNTYPYLSTHSLDKYQWCKLTQGSQLTSGIAAVSRAKVGDDNFGSPFTTQDLEKRSKLKIGDYYYWISLGNGGSCTDPGGNNPDELEGKVRKAFSDAELQKL